MNKEAVRRNFRIIKRKKWPIILAAVILTLAVVTPPIVSAVANGKRYSDKAPIALSSVFIKESDRSKISLIAHRGFSCQAPENTSAAIEKAAEYGFDTVEFDIRQTADGVWVVSHDDEIKQMTDKRGKISTYTYYDLITANIDNGANHKEYDSLKIMTLEEALAACLKHNIKPMIEIKSYTEGSIDGLLEIIDKNGFTDSCCIISFDRSVLDEIRLRNDKITLYVLISKLTGSNMAECLDDLTIGVSFNGNSKKNTEKKIKQLQQANIPLVCWTIDNGETMQKYYDMGITVFVTNRIYSK